MLIGDLLAATAASRPERVAVVHGEGSRSFRELDASAVHLGRQLRALAGRGDRVAILARNRIEYVEALYGVPTAGLVLVLLNYRLHPREWAWILDNCGARVLLVEPDLFDQVAPHLAEAPSVEHVVVLDEPRTGTISFVDLLRLDGPASTEEPPEESDAAFLIYTSGTTGFPKGAVISHRAAFLAAAFNAMETDVRPSDRYLMAYPLCHASGFQTFTFHLRGAEFVLMRAFDPAAFVELIERHRVDRSALAPTMAEFLIAHIPLDAPALNSLRRLSYGGMPMAPATARTLAARFELSTGFGQTESTLLVTVLDHDDHRNALDVDEGLLLSCGRPMAGNVVKILDDDGVETEPGAVGELCVRTPYRMTGYWNNDAATREALASGWLHTGDVGHLDERGYVYLTDRKKDLIISGGQNIYPVEVERAIRTNPAVADVAVIGIHDPTYGERVVAVVVRNGRGELSEDDVIDVCRNQLAGYKRPRQVVFVDQIPTTVTGKHLKRELRAALDPTRG